MPGEPTSRESTASVARRDPQPPGGDLGGPETRSSALEAADSEPYRLPTAPASTVRAITMRCTSLVPSPISPSFASRM